MRGMFLPALLPVVRAVDLATLFFFHFLIYKSCGCQYCASLPFQRNVNSLRMSGNGDPIKDKFLPSQNRLTGAGTQKLINSLLILQAFHLGHLSI